MNELAGHVALITSAVLFVAGGFLVKRGPLIRARIQHRRPNV